MEETNRLDVAADRANVHRSRAALTSRRDDSSGKQPADPSVSMLLCDHDRLQLRLGAGNQPGETDRLALELGDPHIVRPDLRQVFVEGASRMVAADLRAVEDLPVPLLGQFFPQPLTRVGVTRLKRANGCHTATYLARTRELEAAGVAPENSPA
jgi:hypothetical protein